MLLLSALWVASDLFVGKVIHVVDDETNKTIVCANVTFGLIRGSAPQDNPLTHEGVRAKHTAHFPTRRPSTPVFGPWPSGMGCTRLSSPNVCVCGGGGECARLLIAVVLWVWLWPCARCSWACCSVPSLALVDSSESCGARFSIGGGSTNLSRRDGQRA